MAKYRFKFKYATRKWLIEGEALQGERGIELIANDGRWYLLPYDTIEWMVKLPETGEADRTLKSENTLEVGKSNNSWDSETVTLGFLRTHWDEHSSKGLWSLDCIICLFARGNLV